MKKRINWITTNNLWDKFSVIDEIDREASSLFRLPANLVHWIPDDDRVFTPQSDFVETKNHYLLSLDLPGFKKEDIHIEAKDEGVLTIKGKRALTLNSEKAVSFRQCRSGLEFERLFTFNRVIDTKDIQVELSDGVLRVAVPKVECSKPKKIAISESKPGFFQKLLETEPAKDNEKAKA